MIDIHSHIIPKIDDGSKSMEETYEILKQAKEAGFTSIISTSHYIEEYQETNSDTRHAWVEAMNKLLQEEQIDLTLYSGAEIYVTPNMVELIKQEKACTLADSKYVLFELPMNTNIQYLDELIFKLQGAGFSPIIAHPERYAFVQKDPNIVFELVEKGVFFQCNYGSLIGVYGTAAQKTIKKLLTANLIHFLGSDTHKKDTIYSKMDLIMIQLEKILNKQQIETLTTTNPQCILDNKQIPIQEPIKIKKKFKLW